MRTEQEVKDDIKKFYSELNKIRKATLKPYIGNTYLMNGYYYYIKGINDRDISAIVIGENKIIEVAEPYDIQLWDDYKIPKDDFNKAMEKRINIIKKGVLCQTI